MAISSPPSPFLSSFESSLASAMESLLILPFEKLKQWPPYFILRGHLFALIYICKWFSCLMVMHSHVCLHSFTYVVRGANTSVPGWIHIGTGIKWRLVPVLTWNQKTVFPGLVTVREAGSGSGLEKMCAWERSGGWATSSLVWLNLIENRLSGEIPPRLGRHLGAK